jgi:hypothetical protein
MVTLKEAVALAAQDKPNSKVISWVSQIEHPTAAIDHFKRSGSEFRTLDRKLSAALQKTLSGEFLVMLYGIS